MFRFLSNDGLKKEIKWRAAEIRATARQIERTNRLRDEATKRRVQAGRRRSEAESRKEEARKRLVEATKQVELARRQRDEAASPEGETRADSKSPLKDEQDAVADETTALANERKAIADEQKALSDEHKAQADIAAAQRDFDSAGDEQKCILPCTMFPNFIDYMGYWHYLVYTRLHYKHGPIKARSGLIDDPPAKLCPPRLRPWTTILDEQRSTMGKLMSNFDTTPRFLPPWSPSKLQALGDQVASENTGNEAILCNAVNLMLYNQLEFIFNKPEDKSCLFCPIERRKGLLFLKGIYHDHRWDHLYVYKNGKEYSSRNMAYLIECRTPQALSLPLLRVGLRPMDVYKDVVCRKPPASNDKATLFQYRAEKLVAAAVTQTFDNMVQGGMTYGCLTTGEAFVFLKIDWDTSPVTLFYHLSEPGAEVDAHKDDFLCCTALSQMLAFTHAAFDPRTHKRRSQDQIHKAVADLKLWAEDYDNIIHTIPENELKPPPGLPANVPRTYADVDRTPVMSETANYNWPWVGLSSHFGGTELTSPEPYVRQYCTHKCLIGLVEGTQLDDECPNVGLHRPGRKPGFHRVSYATWQKRLRAQLEKTLDNGLVFLEEQIPAGATLQVTMLEYGYTFIAKGVKKDFVHTLHHEVAVYDRLKPLQADKVPVCLGGIDLREFGRTYYHKIGVKLVYLMFMSWGGLPLFKAKVRDRPKVVRGIVDAINTVHNHRVVHKNIHAGNVLWDETTENIMVIDFDGALLPERVQKSLVPILSRKRPRSDSTDDGPQSDDNLDGATSRRDDIVFNKKWLDLQRNYPEDIFDYF